VWWLPQDEGYATPLQFGEWDHITHEAPGRSIDGLRAAYVLGTGCRLCQWLAVAFPHKLSRRNEEQIPPSESESAKPGSASIVTSVDPYRPVLVLEKRWQRSISSYAPRSGLRDVMWSARFRVGPRSPRRVSDPALCDSAGFDPDGASSQTEPQSDESVGSRSRQPQSQERVKRHA
jgi:hypothetical protein